MTPEQRIDLANAVLSALADRPRTLIELTVRLRVPRKCEVTDVRDALNALEARGLVQRIGPMGGYGRRAWRRTPTASGQKGGAR